MKRGLFINVIVLQIGVVLTRSSSDFLSICSTKVCLFEVV